MRASNRTLILLAAAGIAFTGTIALSARAAPAVTPQDARDIAAEAYIYFYPLVSMDVTRRQMANTGSGMNEFAHLRSFPDAKFREVVRSNFDTLYSVAWLDLTKGPVIVSAPDTHGRYYLLPMLDMWTDVFAAPGKRVGHRSGEFSGRAAGLDRHPARRRRTHSVADVLCLGDRPHTDQRACRLSGGA